MSASPPWNPEPPSGQRLWCGGSLRAFPTCRTWEPVRKASSGSTRSGVESCGPGAGPALLLRARVDVGSSLPGWQSGVAVALLVMDSRGRRQKRQHRQPTWGPEQASQRPHIFRASPHTPSDPPRSHKRDWG